MIHEHTEISIHNSIFILIHIIAIISKKIFAQYSAHMTIE